MIRRRFLATMAALAASLGIGGTVAAQDGTTDKMCVRCRDKFIRCPVTAGTVSACFDDNAGLLRCWYCPAGFTPVRGTGQYPRCESGTTCTRALCTGAAVVLGITAPCA